MDVQLEIVWDGNVSGLTERRLSLEAFGPALRELLAAVRRVASDLEMQARGPVRGIGRGRLAREASNLDVQIATLRTNSPVALTAAVVPIAEPARPLIDDLPDRTLAVFLEDIEREAKGAPAHYRVRRFLQALPKGLTEQKYTHRGADGEIRREVNIGGMEIADVRPAPNLIDFDGVLVGIGFEPGRTEVKVRANTGELVTVAASPEQVDAALAFRLVHVNVLAVAETTKTRLLRLSTEPPEPPDPAARIDYVFSQWQELLNRLAQ